MCPPALNWSKYKNRPSRSAFRSFFVNSTGERHSNSANSNAHLIEPEIYTLPPYDIIHRNNDKSSQSTLMEEGIFSMVSLFIVQIKQLWNGLTKYDFSKLSEFKLQSVTITKQTLHGRNKWRRPPSWVWFVPSMLAYCSKWVLLSIKLSTTREVGGCNCFL